MGILCILSYFNLSGTEKRGSQWLKWSDITGNIVHIRRSITQKIKGQSYVETPPKNPSSVRDIQAPQPLLDILAEHKERQRAAAGDLFSEDFRICGGVNVLPDTTIETKNTDFAETAKLPHIRIHDFRHPYVKYRKKVF